MTMNELEHHDRSWTDRLQDVLDDELSQVERSALDSHLGVCSRCRAQLAHLKRIDVLLKRRIDRPSASSTFDQHVYARIHAHDDRARAQRKRHMEEELKENLSALSRGWRGNLLSAIGGALAGMALALAFVAWARDAHIGATLLQAAAVGSQYSDMLRLLMPMAIGAALGTAVSRWLTGTSH